MRGRFDPICWQLLRLGTLASYYFKQGGGGAGREQNREVDLVEKEEEVEKEVENEEEEEEREEDLEKASVSKSFVQSYFNSIQVKCFIAPK